MIKVKWDFKWKILAQRDANILKRVNDPERIKERIHYLCILMAHGGAKIRSLSAFYSFQPILDEFSVISKRTRSPLRFYKEYWIFQMRKAAWITHASSQRRNIPTSWIKFISRQNELDNSKIRRKILEAKSWKK